MTQPFADALTWMPKSRALGATLTRAHDMARAQGHGSVLLEHLLQSLVEDPDASAVLLQCNIDLLRLNAAVADHLQRQPISESSQPEASQSLLLILEYAAAAARQSRRNEVNGAIVLAAMAGEGKSEAARMLTAAGLKFEDAIIALRRAAPPHTQSPAGETAPRTAGAATGTVGGAQPRAGQFPATAPVAPPPAIEVSAAPSASAGSPSLAVLAQRRHSSGQADEAHYPGNQATPRETSGDEDPLTTARRRVAALKSGQQPGPPLAALPARDAPASSDAPRMAVGQTTSLAPAEEQPTPANGGQAWVPPPAPMAAATGTARPMRMPPPVPPMPVRPPQNNVTPFTKAADARTAAQRAPWSDPDAVAAAASYSDPSIASVAPSIGPPIDPKRLAAALPARMQERVSTTVEVRIARSAVLGSAAAFGTSNARDTAITRAVCVRLKAPSGGFYIETAAPETQWFDNRPLLRDDEEVRWRWIITPQSSGSKPLQIAVTLRTIAADGTMLETALPDTGATVKVGSNYREAMRRLGRAAIAVSVGVALTLLATGDLFSVFTLGSR